MRTAALPGDDARIAVWERHLSSTYAQNVVVRQARALNALPILTNHAAPELIAAQAAEAVPSPFRGLLPVDVRTTRLLNRRTSILSGHSVLRTIGLARALQRSAPTAVYSRFFWNAVDAVDAVRLVRRSRPQLRFVTHSGGSDVTRLRTANEHDRHRVRRVLNSSDLTLCGSRFLQRRLQEHYPDVDSTVHYVGVDSAMFLDVPLPRRDSDSAAHDPVRFLACSRLHPVKGVDRTLHAFARLRHEAGIDATLRIVGDGPMRGEIEDLISSLGLSSSVTLVGRAGQTVVRDALDSADVFVQHSLPQPDGGEEGLGVSLLEASARGLPIVATASGGIPEAVLHGRTGFLVAPGDIDGMAFHMRSLAEQPDLRAKFGHAGRAYIARDHSSEIQDRRLHSLVLGRSVSPERGIRVDR